MVGVMPMLHIDLEGEMKKITAAVAVSVLLFAACGGDDAGSSGDNGSDNTEATDSTEADNGDGSGSDADSDFCQKVAATKASFDAVDSGDFPLDDPAQLEEIFTGAVDAINQMSDQAPDELKDDFAILTSAYDDLINAMKDADFDFEALITDPAYTAVTENMDSAEVTGAQDTINAYTKDVCGIDLDSSATTEPPIDGESSDTVPESDDTIPFGGSDVEMAASVFMQMFGLDEAKATCLAEKTAGDTTAMEDPSAVMGVLAECGIELSELMAGMQS